MKWKYSIETQARSSPDDFIHFVCRYHFTIDITLNEFTTWLLQCQAMKKPSAELLTYNMETGNTRMHNASNSMAEIMTSNTISIVISWKLVNLLLLSLLFHLIRFCRLIFACMRSSKSLMMVLIGTSYMQLNMYDRMNVNGKKNRT